MRLKHKPENDSSKELLLREATRLFSAHGFDGVSVKQLAKAADVNVGLISYYFRNKEGLYRSCLENSGLRSLTSARRILTPAKSLSEFELRLQLYAEDAIDTHLQDPHSSLLVQRECERDSNDVKELFESTYSHVFTTLDSFFSSAMKTKLIRKDLEPRMLSFLFLGQLMQAKRQDSNALRFFNVSLTQPHHRETFIRHLVTIFVRGLQIEEASK